PRRSRRAPPSGRDSASLPARRAVPAENYRCVSRCSTPPWPASCSFLPSTLSADFSSSATTGLQSCHLDWSAGPLAVAPPRPAPQAAVAACRVAPLAATAALHINRPSAPEEPDRSIDTPLPSHTFSAHRSFALRDLGFADCSSSLGTITWRVSTFSVPAFSPSWNARF